MTPLRAYRRLTCDVCHAKQVTVAAVSISYLCRACCYKAADAIDASDEKANARTQAQQPSQQKARTR